MQYRVLWAPSAEEKLEQLLAIAADASLLATSAREIDQLLMNAAADFGESRFDSMRVGFVYPLGVQFEVITDIRTVIVHDVWRIDRNKAERS
jgi:hypothetical protein